MLMQLSCPQVGENLIFHARSNDPLGKFVFFMISSGRVVTHDTFSLAKGKLVTFDVRATEDMVPAVDAFVWMKVGETILHSQACHIDVGQIHDKVRSTLAHV